MTWIRRTLMIAVSLVMASYGVSSAQITADRDDLIEKGREYTAWFMAGEIDELWPLFTDEMREALGSREALKEFQEDVLTRMGSEQRLLDEGVEEAEGYRVYTRTAEFSNYPGPIEVVWALGSKDEIAGFFIRPKE